MTSLLALQAYTIARLRTGTHYIIIGVVLLIMALVALFQLEGPVSDGLWRGSLAGGALLIGIGFLSRKNELQVLATQTTIFSRDEKAFIESEKKRMDGVLRLYFRLQLLVAAILFAACLVLFFYPDPFNTGLAFSAIMMSMPLLIIRIAIYRTIKNYIAKLNLGV